MNIIILNTKKCIIFILMNNTCGASGKFMTFFCFKNEMFNKVQFCEKS